jgi:hypothetical protein
MNRREAEGRRCGRSHYIGISGVSSVSLYSRMEINVHISWWVVLLPGKLKRVIDQVKSHKPEAVGVHCKVCCTEVVYLD